MATRCARRALRCGLLAFGCFLTLMACNDGSDFQGSGSTKKAAEKEKPVEPSGPKKVEPPEDDEADETPERSEEKPSSADSRADKGKEDEAKDEKEPELGGTSEPAVEPEPERTPGPPGSVTAGSFTAWTVPERPGEFVDYQIHIKVTLPKGSPPLPQGDLSGHISGTDSYQQSIGDADEEQQFTSDGATALLVVWVPGSFSAVRDTISIRSQFLNENQTLTLVFQ